MPPTTYWPRQSGFNRRAYRFHCRIGVGDDSSHRVEVMDHALMACVIHLAWSYAKPTKVTVAIQTSLLSCREAGKARIHLGNLG